MILDREMEQESRDKILDIINGHALVLGVHDLRATRSGIKEMIAFDIEVEEHFTVRQSHDVTRDVENAILEQFPMAEIMIHVDPAGDIADSRHTVAAIHH